MRGLFFTYIIWDMQARKWGDDGAAFKNVNHHAFICSRFSNGLRGNYYETKRYVVDALFNFAFGGRVLVG
ncbi:hypothetical protein AYP76_04650 [Ligilactobacillus agilis]|uniref:Uncharacterized protein n=1 Tax=Ligilactobacillus agilis TaxID=1601 RepID=A0A6F9YIQ0_9LACO|nr:hypothetical protein AYP76_04650 [Ligilactobacillus agilis]OXS45938.1 hypothetical protein AYP72_06100 [Ligilactobacillus agilis]GET12955.1 hypothetical protein SN811_14550 [Ligilactobacillus agilis]GET15004.1 hypothetical protein SN4111_12660 [Ligilactobacillus agilis]GET17424.1 hypothetical protein NB11A_17150 [Ligilactobacillus agilis]